MDQENNNQTNKHEELLNTITDLDRAKEIISSLLVDNDKLEKANEEFYETGYENGKEEAFKAVRPYAELTGEIRSTLVAKSNEAVAKLWADPNIDPMAKHEQFRKLIKSEDEEVTKVLASLAHYVIYNNQLFLSSTAKATVTGNQKPATTTSGAQPSTGSRVPEATRRFAAGSKVQLQSPKYGNSDIYTVTEDYNLLDEAGVMFRPSQVTATFFQKPAGTVAGLQHPSWKQVE